MMQHQKYNNINNGRDLRARLLAADTARNKHNMTYTRGPLLGWTNRPVVGFSPGVTLLMEYKYYVLIQQSLIVYGLLL